MNTNSDLSELIIKDRDIAKASKTANNQARQKLMALRVEIRGQIAKHPDYRPGPEQSYGIAYGLLTEQMPTPQSDSSVDMESN